MGVSRFDATGYLRRLMLAVSFCVIAAMTWAAPAPAGSLCYVDASATSGSNNGSAWANAYLDLQSALTNANCTEVWV
ncbi:MAG: hypothetical protein L0H70_08140, partial [Xanthomonadales bacterium]|nr:hypothetical protein [Xanthomonadales bacterium]